MFDGVLEQFGLMPDTYIDLIRSEASKNLTEQDFIALELQDWLHSKKRKAMLQGTRYYRYDVEPKTKQRLWGVDADGMQIYTEYQDRLFMDNQYANLVDQKINYLLGKPFIIQTQNDDYTE